MSTHELGVPFSFDDLLRGLLDGAGDILRQQVQGRICSGGVFFNQAEGPDKLARETEIADGKIFHGAGRLSAVISVGGHLHRAHGIGFSPELIIHGAQVYDESGKIPENKIRHTRIPRDALFVKSLLNFCQSRTTLQEEEQ